MPSLETMPELQDDDLRRRLAEAEETLRAIRDGEVDALVVRGAVDDEVFALQGQDAYRVFMESMEIGAAALDGQGKLIYANAALAALLGTSGKALQESGLFQALGEQAGRIVGNLIGSAGNIRRSLQVALEGADHTSQVEVTVAPLLLGFGRGYALTFTDITQRIQARQQALMALTDRLRDETDPAAISKVAGEIVGTALGADLVGYGIVDALAETITVEADWTSPGAVTLAGVAQFRDYGIYIEDLKAGQTVIVRDAYADPRTATFAGALAQRSAVAFVNTPIQERGTFVALLYVSQATPREWSDDELSFIREVAARVRSSAERARSDQALRVLNARLESEVEVRTAERDRMWNTSPDLMAALSPDGRYRRVNPAWKAVLGYDVDDMTGLHATELTHPDDIAATRQALGTVRSDALPGFENRFRHKDGSYRWIQWVAAPGPDEIFAIGRHVTAAKEAEERLAEAEEQLRQSQKMEAVGQLTGGLAHDFNNLLTGITGSLEMMAIRIGQGRLGDLEKYIGAAQGAAKRAAALTHRLLAFSRRQTLDPKPVQPNRLIGDLTELIKRTVGPEVDVRFAPGPGVWTTLIDPNQLENALLNLAINARDAMPNGGKLVIETENRILDEWAARLNDLDPGRYVVVSVADTGTGMTPEVIAKAFDPFFTTKPLGLGTGLGLSMIYGFARQSGGHVSISSEVGQGTTVCMFLPRHLGEELAEAEAPDLTEAPRAEAGETVLVVDDEPSVRMLITDVLEELGYTAIEAADGAGGLRVLQSNVRIDLLISDVGLPGGMNGRQMADAARLSRPDLKVLFVTGYAETTVIGPDHLETGMHIITKPFAMEALATRIRALIEGP